MGEELLLLGQGFPQLVLSGQEHGRDVTIPDPWHGTVCSMYCTVCGIACESYEFGLDSWTVGQFIIVVCNAVSVVIPVYWPLRTRN